MVSPEERTAIRPLTAQEFEQFRSLAYKTFGLDLKEGKEQLVSSRLGKLIAGQHFCSFRDYYDHVVADKTGESLLAMVDVLTTNHTSFLREPAHLEFLTKEVLPELAKRDRIRIWCAASSTGEEPYTLAFSVIEGLPGNCRVPVEILASDISTRVLEVAKRGVYTADRLQGVPGQLQSKYFLRGEGNSKGFFKVKPELRKLVEFRRINLVEPYPEMQPFPVIFCRNVMIYFDKPTQEQVVNRLSPYLEPGGYLFIGHSESLMGTNQPLEYVAPAVYQKPGPGITGSAKRKVRG
jgi:chemotaxis protein methyltransferase CheR